MRKFEPCSGTNQIEIPDSTLGQAEEDEEKTVQIPQRPEATDAEDRLMHLFDDSLDIVEMTTSFDFGSVDATDWQLSTTEFDSLDMGMMYSNSDQQLTNSMYDLQRGETSMTRIREPPLVEDCEHLTDNHEYERVVIDLTRDDLDTVIEDVGEGGQDGAEVDSERKQQPFPF